MDITAKLVARRMNILALRMMMLEPSSREHWQQIFEELDKLRIFLLQGKDKEITERLHKHPTKWSGCYTDWLGWGWGAHPKKGWEDNGIIR